MTESFPAGRSDPTHFIQVYYIQIYYIQVYYIQVYYPERRHTSSR